MYFLLNSYFVVIINTVQTAAKEQRPQQAFDNRPHN